MTAVYYWFLLPSSEPIAGFDVTANVAALVMAYCVRGNSRARSNVSAQTMAEQFTCL